MKTLGVHTKFFAVVAAVSLLSVGNALNAAPGSASLKSTTGGVTGAEAGSSLAPGSVISTGASSTAAIDINGDRIVLSENSTLAIDANEVEETGIERVVNVQLTLSSGLLSGTVGQFGSLSKFIVKIPNGQVALDASQGPVTFSIAASGEVIVSQGLADVIVNRGGTEASPLTARLTPNTRLNPTTGAVTAAPNAGATIQNTLNTAIVRVTPGPTTQPFNFFVSPKLGVSN